ncbi:MAG TPA: uridine kinase [Xanthobacteraceae bacterium]|nr:uridine kinase [Xanthobacteraceae bacterium]
MTGAGHAAVVAVAGPPGGGKTTLVRLLSTRLSAPSLHYDDFEQITRRTPAEVEAWLDRGAPADEVPLPGFAEALMHLRQGGTRQVILDFLLARAHAPTAALIDFMIWIDTPLDIALSRTLREQVALARTGAAAAGFLDWLAAYLDSYARVMHRGYQVQRTTVRGKADMILDGLLAPEELAARAAAEILRRFP